MTGVPSVWVDKGLPGGDTNRVSGRMLGQEAQGSDSPWGIENPAV